MQKYKPKDIIVDAVQYNGDNILEILCFDNRVYRDSYGLNVHSYNGSRLIFEGDYLVKFPDGVLKVYEEKRFEDKFIRVGMENPYLY